MYFNGAGKHGSEHVSHGCCAVRRPHSYTAFCLIREWAAWPYGNVGFLCFVLDSRLVDGVHAFVIHRVCRHLEIANVLLYFWIAPKQYFFGLTRPCGVHSAESTRQSMPAGLGASKAESGDPYFMGRAVHSPVLQTARDCNMRSCPAPPAHTLVPSVMRFAPFDYCGVGLRLRHVHYIFIVRSSSSSRPLQWTTQLSYQRFLWFDYFASGSASPTSFVLPAWSSSLTLGPRTAFFGAFEHCVACVAAAYVYVSVAGVWVLRTQKAASVTFAANV